MSGMIKLLRKFRLFTLLLFFWGTFGLIIGQIEISTSTVANIFSFSCLMMSLDFIILRYNPLIYLHHFLMFAICLAFYMFMASTHYEDSEFLNTYIKWGILVTNTSWIKRTSLKKRSPVYSPLMAYAFLNIVLVSVFAYHFSNYFVPAPTYYFVVTLTVTNIVLSYIISFKILYKRLLLLQSKYMVKSE